MLIEGVLAGLGVDDRTIQQILSMLDEAQTSVKENGRIPPVPTGSFGTADTAAELQLHTGKAHDHVARAMAEMVEGIGRYYDSVAYFRRDVHETDADLAALFSRGAERAGSVEVTEMLRQAADSTQGDDFHGYGDDGTAGESGEGGA